ncbi:uncharacterized protein [Nicotiana sylvestris]|uniref:uncharacterized protein n=1 Tax=Nicotiana sylvestris TaxID=4096 RepID=UPI00388CAC2A
MASDFMDQFRFNTKNAPDVFYIQNLKKKPTETFREYATRWRSEAAKVIQEKESAPNVCNNPLPDHRGKGVNVIETDEEWDPEGSIGLIREGDEPKISPVILTPIMVQIQLPIEVEVAAPTPFEVEVTTPSSTPTPFEVEVTTPFTVMVVHTSSFNSNAIPWDYVAEARRKGKRKIEETGVAQGMTRTGRAYTPEHLGGTSKEFAPKKPIIETNPVDLWRKVQAREYFVVDYLNKTLAQISIISLLQNSNTHRNALMKVLNQAHVPNNITSVEMANMVVHVLESHKITFHKESPEGQSHNRELHITVQFEDKFIAKVLIDGVVAILSRYRYLGLPSLREATALETSRYSGVRRLDIPKACVSIGYEPGKGLGKNLQGITKTIQLKRHGTTFGLSYEYTLHEYQNWSPQWRGPYYPLEQSIPHLHRTVQKTDVIWGSEEDEALAGLRNLFLDDEYMDCNAIVEEEKEEHLTIQTVGKGVVLKNWTVAPSRAHQVPGILSTYPDEPMIVTCNETTQHMVSDLEEEDIIHEEIFGEVENFENKPKSNLDETEIVNLEDSKTDKETRTSIHLSPSEKEEYSRFLKEYKDIFAFSYDDMTGLSTSVVAHKLPTNLMCSLVKQKLKKFKPDMSLKIKEEVTKQIKAKVLRVVEYPTWLANIVLVPKKDGKVRNVGATYMRAMTTIFHDMIHNEIEVYMDDIIIKSRRSTDHITDLKKFFNRLRRYNLKLNPAKCTFGVPAGKLLGFNVSHRGIELELSKVKAIQDL